MGFGNYDNINFLGILKIIHLFPKPGLIPAFLIKNGKIMRIFGIWRHERDEARSVPFPFLSRESIKRSQGRAEKWHRQSSLRIFERFHRRLALEIRRRIEQQVEQVVHLSVAIHNVNILWWRIFSLF